MDSVRVRFAPAPTGSLHVGGARTALFNWLFARSHGGTFILRIEDTDRERSTDEATSEIVRNLRWLGIDWDEGPEVGGDYGPYNQMARLEVYQREASRLLEQGDLYKCFCTPEALDERRKEAMKKKLALKYDGRCRQLTAEQIAEKENAGLKYVLRFKLPSGTTSFEDMVRETIEFDNSLLDDFVVLRSDGTPTYNFTAAVDDGLMKISHVIRGEDHISNTPRQILLSRSLGFEHPRYAHLPLIMGADGGPLSKRHGATAVSYYQQEGFLPQALANYLALLGWSPKDDREFFTLQELVGLFTMEAVGKTAGIFDVQKLRWMNGQYIRKIAAEDLAENLLPFLRRAGFIPDDVSDDQKKWIQRLAEITQEKIGVLSQIVSYSDFFFRDVDEYEEKSVKKHFRPAGTADLLAALHDLLEGTDPFTAATIEERCLELTDKLGIKLGRLIHPARLAVTGKTVGPGFFETLELLGKGKSLDRLQRAVDYIQSLSAPS